MAGDASRGPLPPPKPGDPGRARPSGVQRAAAERTRTTLGRRRVVNVVMVSITFFAAVLATLPLIFILGHLLSAGASSIDLAFFTELPKPPGDAGGGMANAMVGTLVLILAASAFGLPIGIGAGLYLAENRGTLLANGGAVSVGCAQRTAVHRDGDLRVAVPGAADG